MLSLRNLLGVLASMLIAVWLVGATMHLQAASPYFVATTGNDANDCLTLPAACRTIEAALVKASGGDIVIIADGTYTENLTIDKSLAMIGFGADATVIDGGNQPTWAVAILTDAVVSLANVGIVHGRGGIWNRGVLQLNRSTVSNNWGSGEDPWWQEQGAGIRNAGQLEVIQSRITQNLSYFWGGGLYNRGVAVVEDTEISGNEASDTGGGIFNWEGSLTLRHTIVVSNNACGFDPYPTPLCTLALDSTRANKPAASLAGLAGGIANFAVLTATDTLISANRALNRAGGIYNRGILELASTTLYQNSTVEFEGGAVLHHSGTLRATNITISDNPAYPDNGIFATDGVITLTNVTVSGIVSKSSLYHGINPTSGTFSGTISLRNTVVTNNVTNANCFGPIVTLGHNLDSGNTCGFTAAGDLTNTNPLLGPLQDNGGPTPTYALLPGSPAINAGDNTNCPTTDQRGIARPQAGRCDIGAYEFVFPLQLRLPFVAR